MPLVAWSRSRRRGPRLIPLHLFSIRSVRIPYEICSACPLCDEIEYDVGLSLVGFIVESHPGDYPQFPHHVRVFWSPNG
jgi:hypothetical protein